MMHTLLCALGENAFPTTYGDDEETAEAPLAPLALIQLLSADARPDDVVALVTPTAKRQTWPDFERQLEDEWSISPRAVEISESAGDHDIANILEAIGDATEKTDRLTLDVTHGLRHVPFLAYSVALYLSSLRSIGIEGAYYGGYEFADGTADDPAPIIELTPLLELPYWFHAVRTFREAGTVDELAERIRPAYQRMRREAIRADGDASNQHRRASRAEQFVKTLENFSFAYESGLPVEIGMTAEILEDRFADLEETDLLERLPFGNEIVEELRETASRLQLREFPGTKGKWKQRVDFDAPELSRQAALIDTYLERNQYAIGLGLMREWFVSASLDGADRDAWYDRDLRREAKSQFDALGQIRQLVESEPESEAAEQLELSDDDRRLSLIWENLRRLRNLSHHHGMKEEELNHWDGRLEKVVEQWNELRDADTTRLSPDLPGGRGHLLVSPLGLRPGVLYSALEHTDPDSALVVASAESSQMAHEAARQADFDADRLQVATLDDPHTDLEGIDALVGRATSDIAAADRISLNITGGTSLMGIAMRRIESKARKFHRPLETFALVDRRSPDEQDDNPWQVGERLDLDQ
jgi:CRISPR-associated Csx2 family protein